MFSSDNWDDHLPPPKRQRIPKNADFHKPVTINMIREAMTKIRETQVRPDLDGNINFQVDPKTGRWHPFDERDFWLSGKPVGGA